MLLIKQMMKLMSFDFENNCLYKVMPDKKVLTRARPKTDVVAFRNSVVKTWGSPPAQGLLVQRLKNNPCSGSDTLTLLRVQGVPMQSHCWLQRTKTKSVGQARVRPNVKILDRSGFLDI